jgi:hypothetical protein
LFLRFSAKQVFVVASLSPEVQEGTIQVVQSNWLKTIPPIVVQRDDIYSVFTGNAYTDDYLLELDVSPGVRLHAFTFWD